MCTLQKDLEQDVCDVPEKDLMLLLLSDSKFFNFNEVTTINISNTNITEIPSSIERFSSLQVFVANENSLVSLPSSIGCLKELKKLSVSHNKLSELPNSITNLNCLEALDLSHNQFVCSPTPLEFGCAQLTSLSLSHNLLVEWNAIPLCVRFLEVLNLSHNKLQSNPPWLWADLCCSLKELDLSFNRFQNLSLITKCWQSWKTGVTVSLNSCKMSTCGITSKDMDLILQMKSLTSLTLGNMKHVERGSNSAQDWRTSLPNSIWQLPLKSLQSKLTLRELIIPSLQLSELPEDICCLESLQVLNCEDNILQWLPDSICNLSELRIGIFCHNKLWCIPGGFGNLKSLVELCLDHNQLEDLPSSLSNLGQLRWLDLYSNILETVPPVIEKLLPSLHGFDIDFNLLNPYTESNAKILNGACQYDSLKNSMREHPVLGVKRKTNRNNVPKIQPPHSLSSDSSESETEASATEGESELPRGNCVEETGVEEEKWDLEEGGDDYFDPCSPPPSVKLSSNTHILHIGLPFYAADMHPAPAPRSSKDRQQPNDGQFDDA